MRTALPAFSLLPLEDLIDYTPPTVGVEATIWDAIVLMNQYQPPLQYVLVVQNWQNVGLFTWENLLQVLKSEVDLKSSKIIEVMTTSITKLKYSQLQDVKSVLPILSQLKKPIIIEDEQKQLIGYITPETISCLLLNDYQLKIADAEKFSNKNQQITSSTTEEQNEELETLLYFRQAIASSSKGIIITDITGNAIYANPSFIKIIKCTCEELNALGGLSFLCKDKAEYQQMLVRIKEGNSWCNELEIKDYEQDILHLNIKIDPIKDVIGKPIGIIGIFTNITEEVKTQEALQLQNRAFNASKNGIMIFDARLASKPIVYANSEFERICNDSILHPLEFKNIFVKCVRDEINKLPKSEYYSSSKHYNIDFCNYCKDGRELWYQFSVSPVYNRQRKITHYICIQSNITKHKQIEMSLLTAQEKLQQALEREKELNELKSRFVSMTSHEFRTPLSTILSSSELLENYRHKWDEQKQLKHFNRIKTAVNHMINLLNDVLFFGKFEAEKFDCNPTDLEIVEFSQQLVEDVLINQQSKLTDRVNVNINFITENTTLISKIDEKPLRHILNNLLSNAIKYSKPGTSVNFTLYSQNKQAIFEIKDEGIGIPSEDLPSLFDSFYRCKNVGNIQGTGLGLSIVKKCVDMLKGQISVTSELGVGTKFTVSIPLKGCC
ncbi:MAG: ATP-binding protein [Rivularia sp. (in: cyanobacteria)]|jgi:PAS domain S-box-containing protein